MQTPLVSIGVPNYNYSKFVLTALDSVIGQGYQNIEIIIIDDHSTDDSISVIENWIADYTGIRKVTFVKNSINTGITKVCNQVLANASGKYIQFLDADDMILPGKIEKQVSLLEAAKDSVLVYSDVSVINDKGETIQNSYLQGIGYNKNNMPSGLIHEQLFDFNFIPNPSVLSATQMIRDAGGFDETVGLQDYYLWLKLTELYPVIYMHSVTAVYRVHEHSFSNSFLTNPKLVDSILTINYRYYKNAGKQIRNKIKKTIHSSSAYLYKAQYPTAEEWLRIDLLLNPGFKTMLYYLGIQSGLPYSFFEKIKSSFK